MSLTFELTDARDLLEKAGREQRRLADAVRSQDRTEIADAIFNFAVTAYHVKDWLKNSALATYSGSVVEDYVAAQQPLRLCREICNSSKHYELRTAPSEAVSVSTSATSFFSTSLMDPDPNDVALEIDAAPTFRVKVAAFDGSRFEVTQFASQVIAAWEQFFSIRGVK